MEDFGKCLDVPYEGENICQDLTCDWDNYEKNKYYYNISKFIEQEIYVKRSRNVGFAPNQLILYSSNLSISDCVLPYFIAYILMPKHANHYQINDTEMQIIYVVKNNLKVNWAYVIMYHMIHQNKFFGGLP